MTRNKLRKIEWEPYPMGIIDIKYDRVEENQRVKARYKVDGSELFAEEAAMHYYKQNGYNAIWSENSYWWFLLGLLFWDVIFARVTGAVKVIRRGFEENVRTYYTEFDELFERTISINGMPDDFFTEDFYRNRKEMIENRFKELSNLNLESVLRKSYHKHYGQNFRMIEDWDRFSVEELCVAPRILSCEVVLKILERILQDISENRSGLPDLLIYNDTDLFMTEVKSEKDRLSEGQEYWIDFLKSVGVKVELCLINHTERQIANLKKKFQREGKQVTISFGYSTSKKREQAIEFAKSQPTYFTSGEGKEQIHGAVFDVNDIETLYTMLDLTSGWKSQKIQIDGEVIKSTELRSTLWCFRQKNKQGASLDYCRQGEREGEKNYFNCRMIHLDIDRWTEYGYVSTESGDWVFNKEELDEYKNEVIRKMSSCPLFDPKKVEKIFEKIPDKINPARDKDWAYLSSERDKWFNYNGDWYSPYNWDNPSFPGVAAMVGVCKISDREIASTIRNIREEQKSETREIVINIKPSLSDLKEEENLDRNQSDTRPALKSKHSPKPKKKSGCFIATAVYGGYNMPEVMVLRKYRDNSLNKSILGRLFIRIYYRFSPLLANYIKNKPKLRGIIKSILDLIVKHLKDRP